MIAAPQLRSRRIAAHIALAATLAACATLVLFPPSRFAIYPQCPLYEYLGILCPGCGATRAVAALLRGHVTEALRLNWLFVILLPFAVIAGARTYLRAVRPGDLFWPRIPTPALAATLGAALVFTLVRNLPR